MAKRKRLSPAVLTEDDTEGRISPKTRSERRQTAPPPIAHVAGASAAEAALRELSDELASARSEGRLAQPLPLDKVEVGHLRRDRMVAEAEEMSALKASIAERGQQTPIDVVDLGQGRYGLISGWRRLQALRELHDETKDARFSRVHAVLRRPAGAADAYLAMVEENELRVGLSYYERAQVAARAAEADVFKGTHAAIAALFPTASKARRSKIASFVKVYHGLGDLLQFPWEIGERLGLRLAKALADGQGARLRMALEAAEADNAAAELKALTQALERAGKGTAARAEFVGGIELTRSRGAVKLSGPGLDADFLRDLETWLAERQRGRSDAAG